MGGEFEAAGAAVDAGLVAGAIEGRTGGAQRRGKHANTTGACLNCETPLEGAYCYACGQPANISRTLGHLVDDVLHAFLNFDTKTWRTLPQLIVRPGTMTYDYIHGHRVRYVSPLALFLFSIFLMFFAFTTLIGPGLIRQDVGAHAAHLSSVAEARTELADAVATRDKAQAALTKAETEAVEVRKRGEPGAEGEVTGLVTGPRIELQSAERDVTRAQSRLDTATARAAEREKALKDASNEIKDAQKEIAAEAPAATGVVTAAKGVVDAARQEAAQKEVAQKEPAEKQIVGVSVDNDTTIDPDSGDGTWQEQLRQAVLAGKVHTNFGNPAINERIRQQLLNPDLALYKLQDTAAKFAFLLVPISLPFIALLFLWKRNVTLFDHVVFSLYSLSFMSVLFITLALVAKIGDWGFPLAAAAGCIVPPVHMFFHLGGAYRLGWWSALWRTVFLLFFIVFAIVIFALAILALGFLS